MRVLIVADRIEGYMPTLLRQLEAASIPCTLGAPPGPWSWRNRLDWFREALARLPDGEKVVLTDGWDVVFLGSADELDAKIPDRGVLLSGEKNCWPDGGLQRFYPMGTTPWMFVNAGGIAGRVGDLRWHLERTWAEALGSCGDPIPPLLEDDQRFWTHAFLRRRVHGQGPECAIDYRCTLFQSMFLNLGEPELAVDKDGRRLLNLRTGTRPCFLHWNGGIESARAVLERLGLTRP